MICWMHCNDFIIIWVVGHRLYDISIKPLSAAIPWLIKIRHEIVCWNRFPHLSTLRAIDACSAYNIHRNSHFRFARQISHLYACILHKGAGYRLIGPMYWQNGMWTRRLKIYPLCCIQQYPSLNPFLNRMNPDITTWSCSLSSMLELHRLSNFINIRVTWFHH